MSINPAVGAQPGSLQLCLASKTVALGAAQHGSQRQASRTRAQKPAGESVFWLAVGKAAAGHGCYFTQQWHDCRVRAAAGEMAETSGAATGASDLLVVGPGVLGRCLGAQWREADAEAVVTGQTNSDTSHDRLRQLGIQPRLKAEADSRQFPSVVFCAPPSGSDDYPAEVASALRLWDRRGNFVFTSSIGVFATSDGCTVTENSPAHDLGESPRFDRLLQAEHAVLEAGGDVVRLAGLYHAHRGAHTFFLRQGSMARWAGHRVNLLHYEDAASLVLAVLRRDISADGPSGCGRVFLGADNAPITFQDMMDATLRSGKHSGSVTFTGGEADGGRGYTVDASATHAELSWQPRWRSFAAFMDAGAEDFYSAEHQEVLVTA